VRVVVPRGVTTTTRYVTVHTTLQPVDAYANIPVGVQLVGIGANLTAHAVPARTLVSIVGPANAVKQVARRMHATVNVTGLGPGTYTLVPSVTAPASFHIASVYPQRVSVTLQSGT
jgi:hypothetical protein